MKEKETKLASENARFNASADDVFNGFQTFQWWLQFWLLAHDGYSCSDGVVIDCGLVSASVTKTAYGLAIELQTKETSSNGLTDEHCGLYHLHGDGIFELFELPQDCKDWFINATACMYGWNNKEEAEG